MNYPDPFPHKTYRAGSCPDPTPREPDRVPDTTPLGLHLLSEHRLANAHLLTSQEQDDIHAHEHAGPGTIRNHPTAARDWSPTKVRETLSQMEEPAPCPAHGAHPHGGATCLDCRTCRFANTNVLFADMSIVYGHVALRVQKCTCDRHGPFDIADAAAPSHRAWCGWEPICSVTELDQILPSLPARVTREFHERFGLPIDDVSRSTNEFRAGLIREEAGEVIEAIEELDSATLAAEVTNRSPERVIDVVNLHRARVAKELADAVIAFYGTAVTMGIDLDVAVRLVHASNMSKVGADGKSIIREDGKVMKGPFYREPDMTAALRPLRSET